MEFNYKKIIDLFKKHWSSVNIYDVNELISEDGGISAFEAVLLYILVLDREPRFTIEFSPNKGYSTFAISSALRILNKPATFATFEISEKCVNYTKERLLKHDLSNYCEVIHGDAIVEIEKYLKINNKHVDLCFIDSDHGKEFAQKYINRLFPLFSRGSLIAVHDIAAEKHSDNGLVEFKTSLGSGIYQSGEEIALHEFLKENKTRYCVLHSITGGVHENANLKYNDKFFKEIENITNIDFKNPICPKSLWFNLR